MTSQRKTSENLRFTNKSPHFFKVILDETIRDGKLEIPKSFVRKYGKQLPSTIHLEVPSGEIWQVELTKCDRKVWLQKGWQEFATHYSLQHGYFVVFRYDGNAGFQVVIFDRSASEIEYPHITTEEDDALECRKRKGKSDEPCLQPQKKRKAGSPYESGINLKSKISASVSKGRGGMGQNPEIRVLKRAKCLKPAEKTEVLQRAGGCRSKNPSFVLDIRQSYISYKANVNISYKFAMKYLKEIGEATLRVSDGRTWIVGYYRKVFPSCQKAYLKVASWRAFAVDNNLKVGDVCVFELINADRNVFDVVISRAADDIENCSSSRVGEYRS
ncbi:hypothetical protein COLO4_22199 [Corchorus olitorius]|uniref:TF-B3 domain-containing protein n=1 Tax=Corchorus olitorius TaxID=93759 RepID=A0A1R3INL6_9ROSI|nr:hypothetical protein COLO4_22199 [Corchorus olitorius]